MIIGWRLSVSGLFIDSAFKCYQVSRIGGSRQGCRYLKPPRDGLYSSYRRILRCYMPSANMMSRQRAASPRAHYIILFCLWHRPILHRKLMLRIAINEIFKDTLRIDWHHMSTIVKLCLALHCIACLMVAPKHECWALLLPCRIPLKHYTMPQQ